VSNFRIMTHNISLLNIFVRYLIGIQLVIVAGLLQNMPLVVLSIGLLFTCISGWCPVTAVIKGNQPAKQPKMKSVSSSRYNQAEKAA